MEDGGQSGRPNRDQFEVLKVLASAGAGKGLFDPRAYISNAVRYVHNACELLKLSEELRRDCTVAVVGCVVLDDRYLLLRLTGDGYDEERKAKEKGDIDHGCS